MLFLWASVCGVLRCVCESCVVYRVGICDLLFLCEFNVIVWFVCALVCDGVWCVCACVFSCVLFVRFAVLCSNMFVCFAWDVLHDDA